MAGDGESGILTKHAAVPLGELRKLWLSITIAVVVVAPAIYLRIAGINPAPVLSAAIFGIAILAAGFMLSWGA